MLGRPPQRVVQNAPRAKREGAWSVTTPKQRKPKLPAFIAYPIGYPPQQVKCPECGKRTLAFKRSCRVCGARLPKRRPKK